MEQQLENAILTKAEKTKQGLIALFTEEGFLFSVDEETFFSFQLEKAIKNGSLLSGGELALLLSKSEQAHAKQTALRLVAGRIFAQQELYKKLCQKYDQRASAWAIAELQRLGYLNDEAYARARAAALLRKNRSKNVILRDLADKGIGREIAVAVLEELWEEQGERSGNAAAIANLLQKQYARKLEQGKLQQVQAALARRGFSFGEIRDGIRQWQQENPQIDEFEEMQDRIGEYECDLL